MGIVVEDDNRRIEINRDNYKDFAKELSLSYAIFKRLLGIRPQILLDDNVCFYDIETDEKTGEFLFGLVNNIKFNDEESLLNKVQKFRVSAGFNTFRFDNEYLYKKEPQYFKTIPYGNFQLHKIKGCINVDLLPVFMLWNPFLGNHQLNTLAKELEFERKYDLSEKENKCFEDLQIMKMFYPLAKELLNWIETTYLIDPESVCVLFYKSFSKLRRWMLQSWMMQQGTYPKLIQRGDKRKPSFYRYVKRGIYEKPIYVWDAKSAYPVTAVKLNCSLYEEGDFADYEKFLLKERSKYRGTCSKCGRKLE